MMERTGRVSVDVRLPHDRMIGDRIRRVVRRAWMVVRTAFLLPLFVMRRRARSCPDASKIRRVLVLRTDRVGDMVLSTPSLTCLRREYPDAEITLMAPPAPAEIIRHHPAVDHVAVLTDRALPREMIGRFDLAIDLTPDDSLRSALLVHRTAAPYRAGFSGWGRSVFFNLRGPRPDQSKHILKINRELLETLGVRPTDDDRPALFVTPDERGRAQSLIASLGAGAPRVAIHPGAHYPSQRWSPECYADLATLLTERVGAACIVLAGPGENDLVDRVCDATPDALRAGELTMREMMALVACCELFLGNNSGPLHIAGALGIPTVSVMGPTNPVRFGPVGPSDRVIRRTLPCSPCSRGRCWHHTCLRAIEPEEVMAEVEAQLERIIRQREAR